MYSTLQGAGLFLVNTLFDLYLFVLIIRLVLVYTGANYFDTITQFIVKLTDVVVKPLRRLLPNVARIELASIVLVLLLELIKFTLISLLSFGVPNIAGLLLLAVSDSIKLLILTFFYAILLQAILSWVQPMSRVNQVLHQFTAPVLWPLQRIIPLIGGLDFSPLVALIGLHLINMVLIDPLTGLGISLAIR
jgi:YggT family protein